MPNRIPYRQGHIELLEELGRGGMGVVYKAKEVGGNYERDVAVKMLRPDIRLGREERARLHREAEIIARLGHPNIVQIFGDGETDGQSFLVLEYIEGGSLDDRIRERPQPPENAAKLVATLAEAAHAVHQREIIHRDLKPANILLAQDGTPKITDFGLAKRLDAASQERLTETGDRLGTPPYMAPEQAKGDVDAQKAQTDVYALCAILYKLLSGRAPFVGKSALEICRQVATDDPVSPRRQNPNVPRDLETICLKGMEKEPARRYGSAQALADDLKLWLEGKPIWARRITWVGKAWRWAKRNRSAAALIGSLVFAAIVAIVAVSVWIEYDRLEVKNRLAAFYANAEEAEYHLYGRLSLFLPAQHTRPTRQYTKPYARGANLTTGVHEAEKALALYKWSGEPGSGPLSGPSGLDERKTADVRARAADLYVLLALTAEENDRETGDTAGRHKAVQRLDTAEQLGHRSRFLYEQRARLRAQLGDPAAQGDRQEADRVVTLTFLDHRARAAQLMRERKWPEAALACDAALAHRQDDYWTLFRLAFCYRNQDELPKAAAVLRSCKAIRKDDPTTYNELGVLLGLLRESGADQREAAIAEFKAAIAKDPEYLIAYGNLIKVYGELGRLADAKTVLDEYLKRGTREPLEEAFVRMNYALALERTAGFAEALELVPLGGLFAASSRIERDRRYREALDQLDVAVDRAPEFVWALRDRSNVRRELNDYKGAEEDIREAIRLDPLDAQLYHFLGYLHEVRGGQDKDALDAYAQAIRIDARLRDAWVRIREVCLRLKRDRYALKAQQDVVRLRPTDDAFLELARLHVLLKDDRSAIKVLNQLEWRSQSPPAALYLLRGELWGRLGSPEHLKDSEADFTRAKDLERQNSAGYRGR